MKKLYFFLDHQLWHGWHQVSIRCGEIHPDILGARREGHEGMNRHLDMYPTPTKKNICTLFFFFFAPGMTLQPAPGPSVFARSDHPKKRAAFCWARRRHNKIRSQKGRTRKKKRSGAKHFFGGGPGTQKWIFFAFLGVNSLAR